MTSNDILVLLISSLFFMFLYIYDLRYTYVDPMSLPPIIEEYYNDVISYDGLSEKEIIEKYFYIHESVLDDLDSVDLESSFLFSYMFRRSGLDVVVWREPTSVAHYIESPLRLPNCNIIEYTAQYYIDYKKNTYVDDHIDEPLYLKFFEIDEKYYTHIIYKRDGKIRVYPEDITILIKNY